MNNLTLYHSTSEFFLKSIETSGLGAINPNNSYGILNFLNNLFELSEKHLINNKKYLNIQFSTQGMAKQINKGGFNFKHSKTYLTMNKDTAIRYSLYEYGSELLSRSIVLYKLLCENGFENEIDTSVLKFDLHFLLKKNYKKILLKVNNIDVNLLETEYGENPIKQLQEIDFFKQNDIETFNILSQQYNFALNSPINIKDIDIFEIIINKTDGIFSEYKLIKYIG